MTVPPGQRLIPHVQQYPPHRSVMPFATGDVCNEAIGFPQIVSYFLDPGTDQIARPWYQLLRNLWLRSGGALGPNATDLLATDESLQNQINVVKATYLPLAGGTMTGALTLFGNATTGLEAVPLQQMNAALANYLPLSGGTITGNLAVTGNANVGTLTSGNAAFSGSTTGVTQPTTDNSTQFATTAFVHAVASGGTTGVSSFNTRTGAVVLTQADVTGVGGLIANQTITLSGDATGSGATAIAVTLANSGVTAGTYNNVTVNAKGLATAGSNVAYLTANQVVTLSGDVTGSGATAIAATVARIQGQPVSATAPTANQVLQYVSGSWTPSTLPASGTVTSVALSTGTTGLTVTGSPITTSGTFTLAGTLAIANGGTGATTAAAAITALGGLPLTGGTMTGPITMPASTNINFAGTGTSNIYGNGAGAVGITATQLLYLNTPLVQPATDNTTALGGASLRWSNVYAVDFTGTEYIFNVTGNPFINAAANQIWLQASSGAIINGNLLSPASDNVTNLGQSSVRFANGYLAGALTVAGSINCPAIGFSGAPWFTASGNYIVINGSGFSASGSASIYLNTAAGAGVLPPADNNSVLGAGGNRWIAVYAVNGAIQTSGLAEKQDVTECDLGSEFILGLKPVSYRWRSEPEPEEGTLMYGLIGHRKHYGVVAEQVREALGNREFGGLYEPVAEGHWGLCYAELVAPLIKTIQEMDERIKQLEARIAELS